MVNLEKLTEMGFNLNKRALEVIQENEPEVNSDLLCHLLDGNITEAMTSGDVTDFCIVASDLPKILENIEKKEFIYCYLRSERQSIFCMIFQDHTGRKEFVGLRYPYDMLCMPYSKFYYRTSPTK
jgi:hypothetical protein